MDKEPMLGVFAASANGDQVGTIRMVRGQLHGSTVGIQSLVDTQVRRNHGIPRMTWDKLKNWSNGYLWIKEI